MSRNLRWSAESVSAYNNTPTETAQMFAAGYVAGKRPAPTRNGNCPKVIDGIKFDSVAESRRYLELRTLERTGEIAELKVHPQFLIQEAFREQLTGEWVRAITYTADFQYRSVATGITTIEDVKGEQTHEFKRNWKFMRFMFDGRRDVELRIVPVRRKGRR